MRTRQHWRTASIAALLLALCLGMAACAAGAASASSTTSPVSPTPIATATPSAGPALSCGSISQGATLVHPTDAHAAENCFWQAYQQCQPATLDYTIHGVETGTTHHLTLSPQAGGCRITDVTMRYVVPTTSKTTTYTCTGMTMQPQGLLLQGCGAEGSFQV